MRTTEKLVEKIHPGGGIEARIGLSPPGDFRGGSPWHGKSVIEGFSKAPEQEEELSDVFTLTGKKPGHESRLNRGEDWKEKGNEHQLKVHWRGGEDHPRKRGRGRPHGLVSEKR